MNSFEKLINVIVLYALSLPAASAAILTVTDSYFAAPGGLLSVVEKAQSGDIVNFDPSFSDYEVSYDVAIHINKAITVDASSMERGLKFRQLSPLIFNGGILNINTNGDERAVTIVNANFDYIDVGNSITVTSSNFICESCGFYDNRENSDIDISAAINSTNANVALLNSVFISNTGDQGVLYYGTGNLYMVNTFASANFVSSPYTSALFEGVGENQLFYVRNSTFAGNTGHVFRMNTDAGSELDIRHSIVIGNEQFGDISEYQIEANIVSRGYNIIAGLSDQSNYMPHPSDVLNPNPLDVFVDRNKDGVFTKNDTTFGSRSPLQWFNTLVIDGLAYNHGDPLYVFYELLSDYERIPNAFLYPMINALRKGDQRRGIQPRVSDGRLDIGSYEMPVL